MKFKFRATGRGQSNRIRLGGMTGPEFCRGEEYDISKAEANRLRIFERGGFEPVDSQAKAFIKSAAEGEVAAATADKRDADTEHEDSMARARLEPDKWPVDEGPPAAEAGEDQPAGEDAGGAGGDS